MSDKLGTFDLLKELTPVLIAMILGLVFAILMNFATLGHAEGAVGKKDKRVIFISGDTAR